MGFGGDHLPNKLEQKMNRYREAVAVAAVVLGIVFYSGYPEGSWPYIVILAALQIYLHSGCLLYTSRCV